MESTPHLYISALPFSPVKSIIYTEFSPKYSNLAQIVDGGELHWPNLQLTVRGHFPTSVTFSPDGKRIASGSLDNTICLWDAETGLQLGSPLTGHTNFVTSVAFSPDGKRVVSGSYDNTIHMWDCPPDDVGSLFSYHIPIQALLHSAILQIHLMPCWIPMCIPTKLILTHSILGL